MIYQELKKLERGMKLFVLLTTTAHLLTGLFIFENRSYEAMFCFIMGLEFAILIIAVLIGFYVGSRHKFYPVHILPKPNNPVDGFSVVVNIFDKEGHSKKGLYNFNSECWWSTGETENHPLQFRYWTYIEILDEKEVNKMWDTIEIR